MTVEARLALPAITKIASRIPSDQDWFAEVRWTVPEHLALELSDTWCVVVYVEPLDAGPDSASQFLAQDEVRMPELSSLSFHHQVPINAGRVRPGRFKLEAAISLLRVGAPAQLIGYLPGAEFEIVNHALATDDERGMDRYHLLLKAKHSRGLTPPEEAELIELDRQLVDSEKQEAIDLKEAYSHSRAAKIEAGLKKLDEYLMLLKKSQKQAS